MKRFTHQSHKLRTTGSTPDTRNQYNFRGFIMNYVKTKITCRDGFSEYEIDTNGIVYSKRGKPLKCSKNHSGYNMINLMVNGKRIGVAIHRLVAEQFIENKDSKPTVNHIDGNKNNNKVSNLEWATSSEQMQHSFRVLKRKAGSKARKVIGQNIQNKEIVCFDSITKASLFINRSKKLVWQALNGYKKSAGGYFWYYKD